MTLDSLIKQLQAEGVLHSPRIIEAFRRVDRRRFVREEDRDLTYSDIPLPIGFGQTISQPTVVAMMLEFLQPKNGEHCLDIGSGSGWVTALLAELVGAPGSVVAVERIPELAERSLQTVKKLGYENISVVAGDASSGWAEQAPYDVIHVAAAAPVLRPEWKSQLGRGGRLVAPVGDGMQDLVMVTKISDNRFTERQLPGFQFVPLIPNS